jgi:hypothetical protein
MSNLITKFSSSDVFSSSTYSLTVEWLRYESSSQKQEAKLTISDNNKIDITCSVRITISGKVAHKQVFIVKDLFNRRSHCFNTI